MKKRVIILLAVLTMVSAVSADLVLYFDFEEDSATQATGVVLDQSGYGNDGVTETGWDGYALPQYVSSVNGSQAMQFGYDDAGNVGQAWNNVAVAKDASLASIGTQFAMSFWVQCDATDFWHAYPKIISCPNYEIELHSDGDPASYFWPWDETWNNWDFAMAPTNGYINQWMHMAVTYDGATFTQYINGQSVFTKADFATQFDDTTWDQDFSYWYEHALRIGAHADGPGNASENGYLVGALDDVAIWGNCYLEADAVADLYNGVVNPATAPTVPEPMTIALLGLGVALIRRKR